MLRYVLYIFISLLLCNVTVAQDKSIYEKHIYVNKTSDTLRYRLLCPNDFNSSEKYPLVIFLHGISGRGYDNEQQLQYCWDVFIRDSIKVNYPAFVVFPQVPGNDAWYSRGKEGVRKPLVLVNELVDDFICNGSIDERRLYVIGISNGGYGVFQMLEYWPDKYAAAIPICGGANIWFTERYANSTSVWIFHGENDKSVLPDSSREVYQVLKKYGADVRYTEYPGVGHDSWTPTFKEPEIFKWLFSKSK